MGGARTPSSLRHHRGRVEHLIAITSYDRPHHRAEAAAMDVMRSAFNPRYGEAWNAQQLTGFMSLPGVRLSLAHVDNACLGFALSRQVADEAELLLLATDPKWQKRGIGSALLKDFLVHARKSQIETLHLEVRDNNPAIDFYSGFGFEAVHRRPSYYKGNDGTLHDAISFTLVQSKR